MAIFCCKSIFNTMITISVIKCFVITIIIILSIFSCLSFASNSNSIHSDNSIKSLIDNNLLDSHSKLNGAIKTLSQTSETSRNSNRKSSSDSVDQGSCTTKTDCPSKHSYCNPQTHHCICISDFVQITKFINGTHIQNSIPICLPVAKLEERCISDEQCLVSHSQCQFVDKGDHLFRNISSNYCKCKEGYHQEDRDEVVVTKSHQRIVNHPVCGEFVSMGNSWIGTFAIVCIMLLVILIGCFIGILRFQRWKQRPLASTVTSLAQATGHTPHLMSSSPPPMGSVEAEFQNDFIQVFPMHHLEPLPDKNTSHEFVIK